MAHILGEDAMSGMEGNLPFDAAAAAKPGARAHPTPREPKGAFPEAPGPGTRTGRGHSPEGTLIPLALPPEMSARGLSTLYITRLENRQEQHTSLN